MRRLSSVVAAALIVAANVSAADAQSDRSESRVTVPIAVTQNATYGTYQASLTIRLGSIARFPVKFDTGSTGLRLFAVPQVGLPGSGTVCSQIPTSVEFGNPPRIKYSGVVCYGSVTIGPLKTVQAVPFALLTSASCPTNDTDCTIAGQTPQELYARGIYGIFGASLALGDALPNPLRLLPHAYGRRFAVRLTPNRGELKLGGGFFDGIPFPLVPEGNGMLGIAAFRSPFQCVFVKDPAGKRFSSGACPEVVYDTGNGVPFFYANIPGLPVTSGYVTSGTTIGFAPSPEGPVAATVEANDTFAGRFRVDPKLFSDNLVNVGIQGFLGNEVGFDAARPFVRAGVVTKGVMTIAPL